MPMHRHLPSHGLILRVFALGALAAVLVVPAVVRAEEGHGGHEVELRSQDDRSPDAAATIDERGDDDEDAVGANPPTIVAPVVSSPVAPVAVSPVGLAGTVALSIVDAGQPQSWTYAPAQLSTTVGTTLTWTNTGSEDHTVTSDDRTSFNSGTVGPNGAFSFTPTAPATYAYHCALHPWMKATLTVTP